VSGGGASDRKIRIWDVAEGRSVATVDTGSQVCNLFWSRRWNEIISAHGYNRNEINVWKQADGMTVKGDAAYWSDRVSQAGAMQRHLDQQQRRLGDLDGVCGTSGGEVTLEAIASLQGHTKRIIHFAVSPDERMIVSGAADGTLRIWDIGGNDGDKADEVHGGIRNLLR
jgi:WD40 repeat protein